MRSAHERRPVRGWIAALGCATLSALLPISSRAIESVYSRGLYPRLQPAVTAVSNLVPFAVLDLLIVATIIGIAIRLTRVIALARRGEPLRAASEGARRLVRFASVVLFVFLWFWGFNYRREPLETALTAGASSPSVQALEQAIRESNRLGARLRVALPPEGETTYEGAAARLAEPMRTALADIGRTTAWRPGRPKRSILLTPFFNWAGVNGMVDPLALESIVQPDLLPFERPFVLAHEWAHLAGQADEAEANAVGWLACMHGDGALAYSATLYLITEAYNALPPAARRPVLSQLDAGVRADLGAIARRAVRQERPKVQAAAAHVYDRYLKANRVEDGNASYSRALTLILAAPLRDVLTQRLTQRLAQ